MPPIDDLMIDRRTLLGAAVLSSAGAAIPGTAFAEPMTNPFLNGIHKPMTEEKTLANFKVTGTIPPSLSGRYLRIGPNPAGEIDAAKAHWFLGDGMVHGIRIEGGKAVWYRNRWIRSNRVARITGLPAAPGAGGSVNTNVLGIGGKAWALVEAGEAPVRLSETLDSEAYDRFGGTLKGPISAHPHLDPYAGELHAVCYFGMDPNQLWHVALNTDAKVIRSEPIPVQDGPSVHDCAVTPNYVLVFDLPVTLSMKRAMSGYAFPYIWNPRHQARIGLMPRTGTAADMIWIDVDPLYIFHTANAQETADGKILLDAIVYDSMFATSTMGPDVNPRAFERWTIDPKARRIDRAVIDKTPQEFPRIDERLTTRQHRYAYTLGLSSFASPDQLSNGKLFRHDMKAGSRLTHDFGKGRVPGEFVFVPDDKGEDEGWLIGLVIDRDRDATDLVILDAQRFDRKPVASIRIPHRVPPGFHGNWIADS